MVIQTFGFVGNADKPAFVRIELRIERGFLFRVSGVAYSSAKSLQARVRSALLPCNYRWLGKAITINISPLIEARCTPQLDLPIAIAILASEGIIKQQLVKDKAFSGELGLDGSIRKPNNFQQTNSLKSTELISLKSVINLDSTLLKSKKLIEFVKLINNNSNTSIYWTYRDNKCQTSNEIKETNETNDPKKTHNHFVSFLNIKGETNAKRKALIAAAGRHHTIIIGPPGSGKSSLARIIHSIQTDTDDQSLPWRAPHSSTSAAGLIGSWQPHSSGSGTLNRGEWSLAGQGVLFMDEWPEFSREAIEACRVPMETGHIALARASGSITLPAEAQLIAALNPCPCGKVSENMDSCFCLPGEARRYVNRVSGPVADRFGVHMEWKIVIKLMILVVLLKF